MYQQTMDYHGLATLRRDHPAWRLLAAQHAPFVISVLNRHFVQPNMRTMAREDLLSKVEDDLFHLLANRVFFLSRIDDVVSERARFTRGELRRLLVTLEEPAKALDPIAAVPVYDLANLVLSIRAATEEFQEQWEARLGFAFRQGVYPEHWTRVKALSRRFAYQWADEYDSLRPVADLIRLLSERLVRFLSQPRDWKPAPPKSDEQRQQAVDRVMREVFSRLHGLAHERLAVDRLHEWGGAHERSGPGSGRQRARDVRTIYELAAPIPEETPASSSIELLDAVRSLFLEAVNAGGAEVHGRLEEATAAD